MSLVSDTEGNTIGLPSMHYFGLIGIYAVIDPGLSCIAYADIPG